MKHRPVSRRTPAVTGASGSLSAGLCNLTQGAVPPRGPCPGASHSEGGTLRKGGICPSAQCAPGTLAPLAPAACKGSQESREISQRTVTDAETDRQRLAAQHRVDKQKPMLGNVIPATSGAAGRPLFPPLRGWAVSAAWRAGQPPYLPVRSPGGATPPRPERKGRRIRQKTTRPRAHGDGQAELWLVWESGVQALPWLPKTFGSPGSVRPPCAALRSRSPPPASATAL